MSAAGSRPIVSLMGSMSGNATNASFEKVQEASTESSLMRFLTDHDTWFTFGPAAVGATLGGFVLYRNGARSDWWNSLVKPTDKVHPWVQWCLYILNANVQAYSSYRALKALRPDQAHMKKWIHLSHMTSQALNTAVFMMMFGFHDLRWAFFLQIAGAAAALVQTFVCYKIERIAFFVSMTNVVYNAIGLYWTYTLHSKNPKAVGDDKASEGSS